MEINKIVLFNQRHYVNLIEIDDFTDIFINENEKVERSNKFNHESKIYIDIEEGSICIEDIVLREFYKFDIKFSSLINDIIFQRMKKIEQLGCAKISFKDCLHTRFSHSLKMADYCRNLIEDLIKKEGIEKLLKIINDVIPFVEIKTETKLIDIIIFTALVHDIGHVVGSHGFDKTNTKKHETLTFELIDHFLKKNKINYLSVNDIILVKFLIDYNESLKIFKDIVDENFINNFKNIFLSQIISNNKNFHDLDKNEYIKRDSRLCHLYEKEKDFDVFLKSARVINGGLYYSIDYLDDICELFRRRSELFLNVYTEPLNMCMEDKQSKLTHLIVKNCGYDSNNMPPEFICELTEDILVNHKYDITKGSFEEEKIFDSLKYDYLNKRVSNVIIKKVCIVRNDFDLIKLKELFDNNEKLTSLNSIISQIKIRVDGYFEKLNIYDKDLKPLTEEDLISIKDKSEKIKKIFTNFNIFIISFDKNDIIEKKFETDNYKKISKEVSDIIDNELYK